MIVWGSGIRVVILKIALTWGFHFLKQLNVYHFSVPKVINIIEKRFDTEKRKTFVPFQTLSASYGFNSCQKRHDLEIFQLLHYLRCSSNAVLAVDTHQPYCMHRHLAFISLIHSRWIPSCLCGSFLLTHFKILSWKLWGKCGLLLRGQAEKKNHAPKHRSQQLIFQSATEYLELYNLSKRDNPLDKKLMDVV